MDPVQLLYNNTKKAEQDRPQKRVKIKEETRQERNLTNPKARHTVTFT